MPAFKLTAAEATGKSFTGDDGNEVYAYSCTFEDAQTGFSHVGVTWWQPTAPQIGSTLDGQIGTDKKGNPKFNKTRKAGSGGGRGKSPEEQASIVRQSSYKTAAEVIHAAAVAGKLNFESISDLVKQVRTVERSIENDCLNVGKAETAAPPAAPAPAPAPAPTPVAESDEIPF